MRVTKLTLAVLVAAGAVFTSCSSDSDSITEIAEATFTNTVDDIDVTGITIPSNYEFTRGDASSVSFSGQTTRLLQVNEIGDLLTTANPLPTQSDFTNRFNQATAFTNTDLNGSKNVRSKVAASAGLFRDNQTDSDAIKADFDGYITNQLSVLASTEEASQGVAGLYDGKRYFNAKGLEYSQAFYKGLIGSLTIDQALNHYFNRLDDDFDGSNNFRTLNDAETLATDKNYTTMEHHFDEAYGYVYGAGEDDRLLGKYIEDVASQSHFSDIIKTVKTAFIIGRAAVEAKEYEARDAAVEILRYQISRIPAARAVYYLQDAKAGMDSNDKRAGFHSLSEAYGFIYSLQFTYNPLTKEPYFTKSEVDTLLTEFYGSTNGFYDLTSDQLEVLSNKIVQPYDFTVAQALLQ